jgi:YesN/AraC family two-component response regulator
MLQEAISSQVVEFLLKLFDDDWLIESVQKVTALLDAD